MESKQTTKSEQPAAQELAKKLEQTTLGESKNPEESKEESKQIVHGMKAVENKNFVIDLQSKKQTWESLKVPEDIREGLEKMSYLKPSIIQAASIPHVLGTRDTNFMFQAINGSGKTGAFAVPSLMRVDPTVNKTQVIILANTRELIRQTLEIMKVLASETKIQICLGEQGATNLNAHILITVPGYLKNKLTGRKVDLDLSALQAIVYDEADELFMQHNNHNCFEALKKHLKEKDVKPQHCMYSATYNNEVIEKSK